MMTSMLHDKERASGDFFDGWASGFEDRRISPWFQYTQSLAIGVLELRADSRVLDVGCGTGYAVRQVAAREGTCAAASPSGALLRLTHRG